MRIIVIGGVVFGLFAMGLAMYGTYLTPKPLGDPFPGTMPTPPASLVCNRDKSGGETLFTSPYEGRPNLVIVTCAK